MLNETDNRVTTDEEALRVIEEFKALIEFEFGWLRAVKDEEGRITLGALDIAERAMKSKAIEIVKGGE